MNYQGSWRRLLGNSKSAMVAAIEIYNKPRFEYRDEVVVQLLINGWELLLKAIVSKSKRSIYYKKRRGEPYRTLSWSDAFARARTSWPSSVPSQAVSRNLELLGTYRDNAVHFYNAKGFGVVVHSLAQTSVHNYRDVLLGSFQHELADEINWALMPLGVRVPIGPLDYLSGKRPPDEPRIAAVEEFLQAIRTAAEELGEVGIDTSRLLTVYDVSLQSTKRIEHADVVVGVRTGEIGDPLLVTRVIDPNRSHPLRRKEAVLEIGDGEGGAFNTRTFDAIVWRRNLRDNSALCWVDEISGQPKWSRDIVPLMKSFTTSEIDDARLAYSGHMKELTRRSRATGH